MAATQTQVAASQNQIVTLLQSHQENQDETVTLLQNQQQTLARMAATQTQMANAFDQVVTLLQAQNQQLQNVAVTVNTVVSVLETQQETLKTIVTQGQQSQNTTAVANEVKSTLGNQVLSCWRNKAINQKTWWLTWTSNLTHKCCYWVRIHHVTALTWLRMEIIRRALMKSP